jgi:hypothetical protein
MIFKLPPVGHKVWDDVTMAQLEGLANSTEEFRRLSGFRTTLQRMRDFMAESAKQGQTISSVNALCIRADGSLWLVRVTPRAWSKVWDFGKRTSRTTR